MEKGRFCLLLFMLASLLSEAQNPVSANHDNVEKDFLRFREVFESELNSYKDIRRTDSTILLFHSPEILPSWIIELPEPNNDTVFLISASDPGMQEEEALMLAKHRVFLLFCLMNESLVSFLRDNYTRSINANESEVFVEYTRFWSSLNIGFEDPKVLQIHTTQYGETIILASMPKYKQGHPRPPEVFFQSETTLYTHLRSLGATFQVEEKLDMSSFKQHGCNLQPNHISNGYVRMNDNIQSKTKSNQQLIAETTFNHLRYRVNHAHTDKKYNHEGMAEGYNLKNGLWHAILCGILNALIDQTHEGSIHFRHLGERYNDMSSFLKRENATQTVSIPIPGFAIEDNQLFLTFPESNKAR